MSHAVPTVVPLTLLRGMKQTMATHWTSYNTHEGPSFLPEDGRTLMISVVLDAGAQKDFEGIRVIIVQRENEGNEMSVKECTDPARRSTCVASVNYRTALSISRSRAKSRAQYLNTIGEEKLCTVIFELAPSQTYWGQFASLVLSERRILQPSLRIIHDHIECQVPSTLLFLHCSHSAQPEFSPGGSIRKPTRVRAHSVRVIPLSNSRPTQPTFNLPPSILSQIIFFAFSDKQKGWRKGLLSCSLVCKSWAYLVEFFFNDFQDVDMSRLDHDPPTIIAVAQSLRRNLSRAPLIRTYSPAKYLRPTRVTSAAFMAFCEAQNTILRYATSVTDMAIESSHVFLFQRFYDILCGLREVRTLRVLGTQRSGPPDASDIRHLTFEETLKIISRWPHLKTLRIVNWKLSSSFDSSPSSGVDLENIQITCPIENLNLSVGKFSGLLLMRLTGLPSAPPTLRVVRLEAVKGLTNSDFLAFLLRVSPTLVSLSVSACPMWRNSDNEEYAIDAAISSLTSLETLVVEGDLSGEKVLARKLRKTQEEATRQKSHRITLINPSIIQLEINVVSVTGWDSIHVYLDTSNGYSPRWSAEVAQAAKARGIDFRVSISARDLGSDDGI